MLMTKQSPIVVAVMLLVIGALFWLAGPVYADDQVPIKGGFTGEVTSITPDGSMFRVDSVVSGIASHLGRFTGEAHSLNNFADGSYSGTFTWTSANGDTVFGHFVGQSIPTPTPGIFENVETATVTGGTGRFANAEGTVASFGQFDAATLSLVFSFEGTISSVGSNQGP